MTASKCIKQNLVETKEEITKLHLQLEFSALLPQYVETKITEGTKDPNNTINLI